MRESGECRMVRIGRWMSHDDHFEEIFGVWPKFEALEIWVGMEILPIFQPTLVKRQVCRFRGAYSIKQGNLLS